MMIQLKVAGTARPGPAGPGSCRGDRHAGPAAVTTVLTEYAAGVTVAA